MKLRVGDKVKFLNQSGGGVVSKVISSNLVNVAVEDGFDIPTMTSELLKIENGDAAAGYFDEPYKKKQPAKPGTEPEPDYFDRMSQLVRYPSKHTLQPGIYLAYVPHDQKWLITGLMDIYLINNTDFDFLYSFFLKEQDGSWTGIDYDVITGRYKCLLETIKREEIERWNEGIVQMLFHQDKSEKVLSPVSADFRIKSMKFYNESSYVESSFLMEKAIIISLFTLGETSFVMPEEIVKDKPQNEPSKEVSTKPVIPEALIDKYRVASRIAEVDLHISALTDDYSDLKNQEIFQIQVDHFILCLESAIENHYSKVYFIHGVGNGILKSRILEYLKEYEETLEFRDAPYDKYGTGAVEVVIRENL